jgi:hypothetical protein
MKASIESHIAIENQPAVKQTHALVTSRWPQKIAVNVEAKGDCFLESYLVATDNVSNMRSSIQSLRDQLASFYRDHETEYALRTSADHDDIIVTAEKRAKTIAEPYAYFDTIDIYMFEMMTNTTVQLFAMRSIADTQQLTSIDVNHGSGSSDIINMCHHKNQHFTPILPIEHKQANYDYHANRASSPASMNVSPPIPPQSPSSPIRAPTPMNESSSPMIESPPESSSMPSSPVLRRSLRLSSVNEPDFTNTASSSHRKRKKKAVANNDDDDENDDNDDGDDDDAPPSVTVETTAISNRVKQAVKDVSVLKKMKIATDAVDAITLAVIAAVFASSSSSSPASSSSSTNATTSPSSLLTWASLSSSSSSSSSSSLSSSSSTSPRHELFKPSSIAHPTVLYLHGEQAFRELLNAMDEFEKKHLKIAVSVCTEYDEDNNSYTPLNIVGTIASKRIPKNRKCCYMHGQIISSQVYEQRKMTTYKVYHDSMRVVIIDADTVLLVDFECAAGYVNSSSPTQFPNTRYKRQKLRANVKLVRSQWPGLWYYESTHNINEGEELFGLYTGTPTHSQLDDHEEAINEEVSDSDEDDMDEDDIISTQNVHLF